MLTCVLSLSLSEFSLVSLILTNIYDHCWLCVTVRHLLMSCLQYSSNITAPLEQPVNITVHRLHVYNDIITICNEAFPHYASVALLDPVEEHGCLLEGSYFIFAQVFTK